MTLHYSSFLQTRHIFGTNLFSSSARCHAPETALRPGRRKQTQEALRCDVLGRVPVHVRASCVERVAREVAQQCISRCHGELLTELLRPVQVVFLVLHVGLGRKWKTSQQVGRNSPGRPPRSGEVPVSAVLSMLTMARKGLPLLRLRRLRHWAEIGRVVTQWRSGNENQKVTLFSVFVGGCPLSITQRSTVDMILPLCSRTM